MLLSLLAGSANRHVAYFRPRYSSHELTPETVATVYSIDTHSKDMVPDDSNRMGDVTRDPAQIETWARETGSIPVSQNGHLRFVDEETFDENLQSRLNWDDFFTELTESDRLVCRERDHLRVRHRDDVTAHFEGKTSQHQHGSVDEVSGSVTSNGTANPRSPVQTVSSDTVETERDRETGGRPSSGDPSLERIIPTSDDQGKLVVDSDGTELGVVAAVDDDHIYVGSRPNLLERVLSKLGLGDEQSVSFVLDSDTISQINDDRIVVRTSSK